MKNISCFVDKLKKDYGLNNPIRANDILSSFSQFTKAYVFRLVNAAIEKKKLTKYSRGVYYIPKETIFGPSSITSNMVIQNRYIHDGDNIIGVYSGLTLLNMFSVITQVPMVTEIVSNRETTRKRTITIEGFSFVLRKSRFTITKKNYNYYTILQLFTNLKTPDLLNEESKTIIVQYLKKNKIDQSELLRLALAFPAKTMKNLVGSGVLSGIISKQRSAYRRNSSNI